MQIVSDLVALRSSVRGWRAAGERIAVVPTMGNLHAGHFGLVALARRHAQRVVATIFVNPTQFGPSEDFERYPRTPANDEQGLGSAGCDLLFRPGVEIVYPRGVERAVRVEVPGLSDVLCGAHRPGHFAGVATVVARLLNMVQPDVAVFGRKDLQQLQLIRHLVDDLAFPVEIIPGPTRREPDGLAMSSRNQYLDPAERLRAPALHRCLGEMLDAAVAGTAAQAVEAEAMGGLRALGFEPDYAVLRHEDRLAESLWGPVAPADRPALVALVAARLGRTRLIDNLALRDWAPDAAR